MGRAAEGPLSERAPPVGQIFWTKGSPQTIQGDRDHLTIKLPAFKGEKGDRPFWPN